jgi:hypothetical protein
MPTLSHVSNDGRWEWTLFTIYIVEAIIFIRETVFGLSLYK